MTESTAAKRGETSSVTIRIVLNSPPSPLTNQIPASGDVYLNCGSACWVWTSADGGNTWSNCFTGEQNHYVSCNPLINGPYTPSVAAGTVITIEATAPNSNPPELGIANNLKGTITITSGAKGKEHNE